MAITPQKKKTALLNSIIAEVEVFETAMKKRKPVIKNSDEEIVAAIKKLRQKNRLF